MANNTINSNFSSITVSIASPDAIFNRSHGEVVKPETINYRTYKPEPNGLFCEKIFGPVKDWECHCGKYKRIRYKNITCDHCGVEVTEKKVRRERMGHIKLVVPVAHIWYFRSLPNKIGALLGIPAKKLDTIIYYERYIVIQPGILEGKEIPNDSNRTVQKMEFLTEEEYLDLMEMLPIENQYLPEDDPNKFIAKMGAEAIYDLLSKVDLDKESYELRAAAQQETAQQRKQEALKRLQVFEAFREANKTIENRPEWMVVKVIPVIPPELRPLVPLDGGRFATSDLNDLYRRVIIRNNRLKRLIEINAPDVIMRNEKRMLQEAVDSLFDNSRKSSAVKTESNRPLKSLSDSLKGKQGRFRQNLLGKRVDYSGRSVIVVGPDLNMNECGLPKDMAAELFKPFVIRKLIEQGIVKTVKSAKKIVDRKDPIVWDILENILKGHPILLNRAPTLHRLSIQAFQPKLVEGKAIRLHPLVCTAFNADFDGDQMAIHVPLGNAAILEAQILMLASHNILNPSNGAPITLPSQDMVLGLYYITKERVSTPEHPVKGEGMIFYSPQEVIIAHNEGKADMHAKIQVRVQVKNENGELVTKRIPTTVGRVIFNQVVPEGFGFINKLLTKKALRSIVGDMVRDMGTAITTKFLDDIKNMGYHMAFKGGLSFNLGNILIPEAKDSLIKEANAQAAEIRGNEMMGFIGPNERYNQIVDLWTDVNKKLTQEVINVLTNDDQGFNSVFMMLDSGARGSEAQVRQLCGMRGLMAKPMKAGASGGEIIENPILSNFKEGLSVLEYFISTHGARKGLADTALKTADAGYLTRRLVDVAHDVIINEKDCGTLRGLTITRGEEIKVPGKHSLLYDRILGRVSLLDVYHPQTGELIVKSGEEITEKLAEAIDESPLESVEIRSVLTCESKQGVCANCYGRNLASSKLVQKGEAVGVIAAQSIGEPGTQLTLRTFHIGGAASKGSVVSSVDAKYDGYLEIDDLRSVNVEKEGEKFQVVTGRAAELKLHDSNTNAVLMTTNVPYGAKLYFKEGDKVKKGEKICEWDPYNAVIVSEYSGIVKMQNLIEGVTYRRETIVQTGFDERVVIEGRGRNTKNPLINIVDKKTGEVVVSYDLPVDAHIVVKDDEEIKAGDMLVRIPRSVSGGGDITGGLPRVQELFEARNPSEPAVVSEIDGIVSLSKKLKRGHREIVVTPKDGDTSKSKVYLVPTSRQILAQENDFVKAGQPLSEGAITPASILSIMGPMKVQEYIVNEVQSVYRSQGVVINDKHFEVIVRQMMRKVEIIDPGDTRFLEGELVGKQIFQKENDDIYGQYVVTDPGESEVLSAGQIITAMRLRDENSTLKRKDKKLVEVREAQPATATQVLQGITRAALQTESFISAASFQETTKVLTNAAISAKTDYLRGMKENVIVGHKIPAGTGLREYDDIIVASMEDYQEQVAKAQAEN